MQRLGYALALGCGLAIAGCGAGEDDLRPYDLEYLTATIFQPTCGATQCHSQYSRNNGVSMDTPEHVRETLVRKRLVTFDFEHDDRFDPRSSDLIIWVTEIDPFGAGIGRMPLDAPMPDRDVLLIKTWIRDVDHRPASCVEELGDHCGAGGGLGAQCEPGQYGGLACNHDQVVSCRDDWSFDNDRVAQECPYGCLGEPRPGFGGDLQKTWCLGQCGNKKLDGIEPCDDGNDDPADGCNACKIGPICGDGMQEDPEECDDHNRVDLDGCDAFCKLPVCGNKKVEPPNEQCDDGNASNLDRCSTDCKITPVCGDKIVDAPETCDDGNMNDGDGCSHLCMVE